MYTGALAAGPRLLASPETWEMGNAHQWDSPSTEIDIKNTGDQPLVVERIKPACGFTAEILPGKTIKPGETGRLRVSFSPFGASPGPIRRDVVLITHDPVSPKKVILINGRVLSQKSAVVSLDPDYIDVGVVAPYETRFFVITISNKGNIGLNLDDIDLPEGFFLDSSAVTQVPSRGVASVRVGYRPAKQAGPINEDLTFKGSDAALQELELKARVVGYIAESARSAEGLIITPAAIKVSPDSPNPEASVSLKNAGGGKVFVEEAESSLGDGGQGVTSRELKPGESGRVSLPLAPSALAPDTRGYLYIRVAIPIEVEGPAKK